MDKELMDDCVQRVIVNGSMTEWKPVVSGVSQGSRQGLILFNTFLNGTDSGIECTFIKCADDIKLSCAVGYTRGKGCHPDGSLQA